MKKSVKERGREPRPCRLCGKSADLCDSHIIPELAHSRAYDESHRVREIRRGDRSPRWIQKGIRDRLLCRECEGHLNQWESYFNETWYRQVPTLLDVPGREIAVEVDYARFKLFHLSVLWRASISTARGFDRFRLPDEERLWELLIALDPGPVEYWRVVGAVIVSPGTLRPCHGVIMPPAALGTEGRRRSWTMLFAACAWTYLPDGAAFPEYDGFALDAGGTMRMPVIDLQRYTPAHRFFVDNVTAKAIAQLIVAP